MEPDDIAYKPVAAFAKFQAYLDYEVIKTLRIIYHDHSTRLQDRLQPLYVRSVQSNIAL